MRWCLAALFLLTACSGPEGDLGTAPDTATRIGRIDLSIGQLEGPAEYTFGRVSGVAEGPRGEVYVSDAEANVIRVFDSHGAFLRSIGREGQGPGELEGPCCVALGPSGRLWVRDNGNRRYNSYLIGEDPPMLESTVRMNHYDGSFYAPITFSSEGQLVDVGHYSGEDGVLGLWRFVVSDDGTVQDKVLIEEPTSEALGTVVKESRIRGGLAKLYFPQPYGPASLVAHGPGGQWATAVSSRYVVALHGDTSTIEIHGPDREGPLLSSGERERAAEQVRSYVQRGGGGPSDYPAIPDRKALLNGISFDVAGRLWVEVSVPSDSARRADLYDRRGTLVGSRTWPSAVHLRFPAWIGEDHALGIVTDSLGVQSVVRIRFER